MTAKGAGSGLFVALAALLAGSQLGLAQVPVSRARFSFVSGAVELKLRQAKSWQPAMIGAPLEAGASIQTLESGRAEILLAGGATVRLIPGSQLALSALDSSAAQVQLIAGTLFVTMRKPDSPRLQLRVGTEEVTVGNDFAGRVDAGSLILVTTYAGKAELIHGRQSTQVDHGQVATVRGSKLTIGVPSGPADPWTTWSRGRDAVYADALHNGVQPASLADYANWYAQSATQPAFAQGTGLTYAESANCPWTVTNGDYQGWCWSEKDGWMLPVQPVDPAPVSPSAANEASLMSQNASWAGMGGWGSADPFFGPPCFIVSGLVQPFCLNQPFGFGEMAWFDSPIVEYVYVPVAPVASGFRNARLGVPRRDLGRRFDPVGNGVSSGLHRLGPPPRLQIGSALAARMVAGREAGFRAAASRTWANEGIRASHTQIGRKQSFGMRAAGSV
ncbi:MAG: FecR domain-containing protein, partial [Terriglobales bacterium]